MTKISIENSPRSCGRKELLRFTEGKPLTRMQAMEAKCFECCNGYIDGRVDCKVTTCPLHTWMPYREVGSDSGLEIPSDFV